MFRDSGALPHAVPPMPTTTGARRTRCVAIPTSNAPDGAVKHSLFNALKLLRPVVVLDEAHKAYGGKGAA